jgi:hypothetical protein
MRWSYTVSGIAFALNLLLPGAVEAQPPCPQCIQPGSPVCPLRFEGPSPVPSIVTGCNANLANLAEVAGRRFTFFGFPLRIRGGHGSPVRAVAMLDD